MMTKTSDRKNKISVSVMCSDLMNLGADIMELEKNGVDMLHVDMMDAHFVPNLTFGLDFLKGMHRVTAMPLDIHLMADNPFPLIQNMDLRVGDIVSVHVELPLNFAEIKEYLNEKGIGFGLVVNPATPVDAIEPYIPLLDTVTLMLVQPGFAGGKLIDGILDKVKEMRDFLDGHGGANVEISVDGSVSCERARLMADMGASIFVGGTAGIYRKGMTLAESIPLFRESID